MSACFLEPLKKLVSEHEERLRNFFAGGSVFVGSDLGGALLAWLGAAFFISGGRAAIASMLR